MGSMNLVIFSGIIICCAIARRPEFVLLFSIVMLIQFKRNKRKDDQLREEQYEVHWIRKIISKKTIKEKSFEEWIGSFKSRYSDETIKLMEEEWVKRK